jgi:hypothetical protein
MPTRVIALSQAISLFTLHERFGLTRWLLIYCAVN